MARTGSMIAVGACTLISLVAACGTSSTSEPPGGETTSSATATAAPPSPTPVVAEATITEEEPIPFEKTTVQDSSLDRGKSALRTRGVNGVKTVTYKVTTLDGVETSRVKVDEAVTTPPTTEVVAEGTSERPAPPPASSCDPNYSGCVPIASDVDCEGGSGNGPAYVRGPIRVIGDDIYGLDNDNDGIACE